MAIAITNRTGTPHIKPEQDASWHRGYVGMPTCVLDDSELEEFAAQIVTNNQIRIRSGIAQTQGRLWWVPPGTYDLISIANGTQGQNRVDRVVMRWTVDNENNTQNCDWEVIQGTPTAGTPAAPAYTQGDLDDGDLVADMPMFQVRLTGINIASITPEFDVAMTIEAARISQETIDMFDDAGYPIDT